MNKINQIKFSDEFEEKIEEIHRKNRKKTLIEILGFFLVLVTIFFVFNITKDFL
jgi:hypothetical protein